MKNTDLLDSLLNQWLNNDDIVPQVENWTTKIPSAAQTVDWMPPTQHPALSLALHHLNIDRLYTHQFQAFEAAANFNNVMIVTGTASGKSLCFTLPVLDRIVKNPLATALFLFPTKALSQDQLRNINTLISSINQTGVKIPEAAIYDGDTPSFRRSQIRTNANIIITNPDMLHLGILPHHTSWDRFFTNLAYIIIDEAHTYRGIFGSHVCNVIRRLKRIAAFYGKQPQFILTSATISNPEHFAQKLIEEPVKVIMEDGAPRGARHFIVYNPPFIEPTLGIRRSAYFECINLARELLDHDLQTIVFARSRQSVEKLVFDLKEAVHTEPGLIRGYRSGYLPQDRREIEKGLKEGVIRLVVATNALELGIDIGEMKASIMVGYPGSIAALQQQAGRAGRKTDASLSIMIATAGAIDQYLARHPEFLNKSPENALIDPDNLIILLQHLRCAAFELPITFQETFGNAPQSMIDGLLELLAEMGIISKGTDKYYWTSSQYPTNEIPLRSASPEKIILQILQNDRLISIGEIDPYSAYWMTHPQAIYLHDGSMYHVDDLNLDTKTALLSPVSVDYFTEARSETTVEKISLIEEKNINGADINYGELLITSRVTGYKKVHIYTRETLGEYDLEMPQSQLRTTGYWLTLQDNAVEALRLAGKWNNDRNNYGPHWNQISLSIRRRDQFKCQGCGVGEKGKAHHVHHKTPLRCFHNIEEANHFDNLTTLCPSCHRKAEAVVGIRSGLNGLRYALQSLAPLFLMCDVNDIASIAEPESAIGAGKPTIILYDLAPGGIGLSHHLFQINDQILKNVQEMIKECGCFDGCPACVGPGGEFGSGGKQETLAILDLWV